ncbi:MAG: P-loop NTPase [Deltaproteobacteria bacterium]|nr:P-loop NTPase [Deltaproteobacteria bacterium]MBN2670928.1 P-loop NTPase [Deltaproteobacteria bacterium]
MAKLTFSIGGGKGGTGKSVVAANLAVTMAQSGKRVVLVDGDLGAANLHTMFGIDRPKVLLEHFIRREVSSLEDALTDTALPNLKLVCGGMPTLGSANPAYQTKQKFLRHIRQLEADVVISDIGAGTHYNVLDLFNFADVRVVVFTSQLTSVHNGYGFLKAALHRYLQRIIPPAARQYLDSAGAHAGEESLADMLTRLANFNVSAAEQAKIALSGYQACLVGNMLASAREGFVINAVSQMVRDHLHLEAPVIGLIRHGEKITRSVNERAPFMMLAGIESNAELFRKMATTLIISAERVNQTRQEALVNQAVINKYREYDRRYPRFRITIPVRFLADGELFAGVTKNLGQGGIGVYFDSILPSVEEGVLRIGPFGSSGTLVIKASVRHREDQRKLIGLSFADPTEEQVNYIEGMVAKAAATTTLNMPENRNSLPTNAPC